ncbi:MAG: hypothetical protein II287_00115, partial [Bacteroidaceae bacterium]|nr:hypothetical protein [Bacteroidaceae bacterium]
KELEGKMHRSEDVEAVMTDLVYTIRSMLMALPGRLAVDVVSTKTAAVSPVPEQSTFSLLWQYYVKGRKTYHDLCEM